MDLGLSGRNCVVTGGSRGIGRSIALGLAAEGANIAICARNEAPLRQTEAELIAKNVNVYAAVCDLADPEALSGFLDASRDTLGDLDVFVHNASALAVGPDSGAWDASFKVDLMAAVHACEKIVPWMTERGSGSILFVSSVSGIEADPMPDYAYTAAKAALIAYGKKLALQHARSGIRVNSIAPGSIEFPGGAWAMVREHQPEMYGMVQASIASGRLGTPEEVADVAVYLVSSRANWVTGATVVVDGGQQRGIR